ncbi:MAG: hypothetical protein KDJ16_17255, partial [Hyphomicrobiales bacterium]|nr:hypothetical protein [Hyphomicrobiales bacterium]
MSINTISSPMTIMAERFRAMRNDLVKLQEQLGTGRRADTYGGLGAERDLTIGFRAEKALTSGYRETIRDVNIRLDVMQTALTRLDEIALEAKSAFQPTPFQLIDGKQTAEQKTAREQLEEIASLLNSEVNGRYLFSGQTTDTKPVLTVDTIVEGDGTRAGLRQVIAKRRQADLGADGRG